MNNKYIGKTCPFCKAPFTENDDIVICSQCDMPHHKDCWVENGGCTTFGCLGTIKAVDANGRADSVTTEQLDFEPLFEEPAPQPQPQRQQQSIIYCTRCGNPNSAEGSFCGKCGSPLSATTPPPNYTNQQQTYSQQSQYSQPYSQQSYSQQTYSQHQYNPYGQQNQSQYHNPYGFTPRADGYSDARMQFVGQNQAYYAPKFNAMITQNKKASWNWCAFFFAPYWCIYRKMYEWGAGILAAAFILSLIPSVFVSLLSIGGYIAFGILGNYVYMKKVDTLVAQSAHLHDTAKYQFVAEKGGVNKKATTWVIIGYIILNTIINVARM